MSRIQIQTNPKHTLDQKRRRAALDIAMLLDHNPLLRQEVAALFDTPQSLLSFAPNTAVCDQPDGCEPQFETYSE